MKNSTKESSSIKGRIKDSLEKSNQIHLEE